jgi:cellobiose-specific phosphotransferase system component IIA
MSLHGLFFFLGINQVLKQYKAKGKIIVSYILIFSEDHLATEAGI